jgi:anti-sigma B factor antagonist
LKLEVVTETKDHATLVHITGEVDLYSSPEVRKEILKLTKAKTPAIVVNLENVNYMDSSGVATLIEGLQQCGKYKGRFALAGLRSSVKEVFELTRLDKVFEIHKDVKTALEKIKA